ncbi:Stp1/IreP family PP2C-type Ser/Thr phosphatase [Acidobacteriota bacterium]
MKYTAFGLSDVGKKRTNNEDHILQDDELGIFVVCDGMGGHAAGEVASSQCCSIVHDILKENYSKIQTYKEIPSYDNRKESLYLLEEAIHTACKTLYDTAVADDSKRGMGTTCVVIAIAGDHALVAHVGDSRAYMIRQGAAYQITEDHSFVSEHLRKGLISPEEATKRVYRSVLTRSVGYRESVQVDTLNLELMPGDAFLICTDGLTEYLDEDEYVFLFEDTALQEIPKKLVDVANNRGGKDNISCIAIQVEGELDPNALHADKKIEALRRIPLFEPLDYLDLIKLLNILQVKTYPVDDVIIKEGEKSDMLYIVNSGKVKVSKQGKKLAGLLSGHFFGEMGVIDKSTRSADVVALEPTQLLAIPHEAFRELLQNEYRMALKVLWAFCEVLNERLRSTSQDMADLSSGKIDLLTD